MPDDEERAEGKKPATGKDFRRVKTFATKKEQEAKEYRAKVETYERELAELRKRPATNADEIQKMQAELASTKGQLDIVALEFAPEFNQKFGARAEKVHNSLKEVLAPETLAKAGALLQLPESPHKHKLMSEFLEELTPYEQGEITAANRELRAINQERMAELGNSHAKLKEISESRQKQQQERAVQMESLFDAEAEAALKQDPLYQIKEGDSKEVIEWNESVKERREVAKAIFKGALSPKEMARNALAISGQHILVGQLKASQGRIAELEAVVAKLQGSGPDVGGSGGKGGDSNGPKKGFFELIGDASKEG